LRREEVMQRHPLTLLTREVPPLELRPGSTSLLLQDLHAPFADLKQGHLARKATCKVVSREFDEYFETLRLVTPNLQRLVETARKVEIDVIYSCLGYESGAKPSDFQHATGWCWDLAGADGAFPSAWRPRDGEAVFAKPGWGALGNPAFDRFLAEHRGRTVIVVGTMFEFGIQQTCMELGDRGIGNLVVSDAVVPLTLAGQDSAAGMMAHGLTKLRSTAETLDLLATMASEGMVLV
jgi:nicotinamidase-related amidase